MGPETIHPGGLVFVWNGQWVQPPLKVAAIFTVKDRPPIVYALAWNVNHHFKEHSEVFRSMSRNVPPLGEIGSLSVISDKTSSLDALFSLIVFSSEASDALKESTFEAAISRDLVRNVLGHGTMRVRLPPTPHIFTWSNRKRKNTFRESCRRGYLVGDITNAIVDAQDSTAVITRAGLARGKGQKALARDGDGGSPLLSSSNALIGFVVGTNERHTLVLPAEDLVRDSKFRFLTQAPGPNIRPGAIRARRNS